MTTSTAVAVPKKEQWTQEIQRFDEKKYLVLAPVELGPTPPMHTPMISVVPIDPDPKAGDVYELSGKFAYSKAALDRVAAAAGISWVYEMCGRTDAGTDPEIVRFRMAGKRKELDGQWRVVAREYEFDLRARQDELEASAAHKNKDIRDPVQRQAAIEASVARDMIQLRKFKVSRAESGAANRVVRVFLGIKANYTREQIIRPLVVPKLVFTPDYSDPEVKKFMLAEATGTISELYLAQATAARGSYAAPIEVPESRAELEPPDQPRALTAGDAGGGAGPGAETAGREPQPSADEQALRDEAEFREAYNAEDELTKAGKVEEAAMVTARQLAVLTRMLARKRDVKDPQTGKPLTLNKPLAEFTRPQRLLLFDRLHDMPEPAVDEPAFA
jgi:hypothetical protein